MLIDSDNVIIAGHGRYEAAQRLGLKTVPTVQLDHLSEAQVRAYRIADNRIAELSDWDEDVLGFEIGELVDLDIEGLLDFDVDLTGFDTPQIDIILDGDGAAVIKEKETLELPAESKASVAQPGDLWALGPHRIICGDALDQHIYIRLMDGEKAQMVFTDPPYNVPINGHVRTGDRGGHREFAMAVGEMTNDAFRTFLRGAIKAMGAVCMDGAVLDICMDWRHIEDLIHAGKAEGLSLINLCIWNKTNGGMGSLYRSKHEMVAIFKQGTASHVNNVELGRHGRYRTNVWDYAGMNTFRKGREADLVDHPTVKPTALIMDALKDVSHRGDIVLDPFGGSGSTLLAAEKTGRQARLIELDPLYVDVAIRRWQELSGKAAIHTGTGERFAAREIAQLATTDRPQEELGAVNVQE